MGADSCKTIMRTGGSRLSCQKIAGIPVHEYTCSITSVQDTVSQSSGVIEERVHFIVGEGVGEKKNRRWLKKERKE